ncbi:MAG: ImmA/IrrE family metallo-endopeptidase [Acidobacteria bacterium]|nr:ImmA/IrrE family metallo-endopeptidase [Acidobacteriota bacterium]
MSTTSDQHFTPDWVSAPGDTIADILHEKRVTIPRFAKDMEWSIEEAKSLLGGRTTITIAIARKLARIVGSSVEFWMSRDFQYRKTIDRLHHIETEWLNQLPIGDMIKFGWVTPSPSKEVKEYLRFFGVPSLSAWTQTYSKLNELVAFKTSQSFESRPASVAAWLRQGEIESSRIKCSSWNPSKFKESLSNIRRLTRSKRPNLFVSELQKLCSLNGVAVIVLRAPSGCRASGATRFLSKDQALLLLSFRYLSDDQFWFTFFHEAGHLLLHGEQGFFLEGMDGPRTKQELEADKFAEDILIPQNFQPALMKLPLNSKVVIKFAQRLGISPGIVVGQLQHHGKIKHSQLNGLRRRFQWGE